MQNGQIGVIIVVASIFFSVGGGFLFNTKDVAACGTEFDYVTDITGAFTGTQGNIEIEHNPAENISGYSVFNPTSPDFKSSTISGITYTNSNPNAYWIQKATGEPVTKTLTISHNLSTNGSNGGTVTYDFGSGTSPTSGISRQWGLDNAEIRTIIVVDGTTYSRVAGVTVQQLYNAYSTWAGEDAVETNKIRIYFDSSTDGYPGFITNQSFNDYNARGSGGYYGLNIEVKYGTITNDIVLNPTNGSIRINDVSYSWTEVYAVWGTSGSTSAAMTMILGGKVVTEYINPLNGIKPVSVTINDPTQEGDTANAIHVGGSLYVPANGQEYIFDWMIEYKENLSGTYKTLTRVTIIFNSGNGNYDVMDMGGHTILSGNTRPSYIVNPLTINWDWNENDLTNISFWAGTGSMPVSPATRVVTNIPDNGIYELKSTYPSNYPNLNNIVVTLTNNSSVPIDSGSNTGGSAFEYITTYNLPAEVTYTTTYWSNSVENTQIAMVFSKPSVNTDNIFFINYKQLDGTYVSEPIRMKYDSGNNGWYFYDSSTNAVNLGEWPAMMLTIRVADGQHNYVLTPIQSFSNFQSMTPMNREYTFVTGASNPVSNPQYESITYMQFNNTDQPYPYQEVIRTTVFLKDGGLYLNNGWFSPSISFPTDKIIQFRLMSAARAGESVTISTDPAGFAHDGDPIQIDGSEEYSYEYIMLGYLPGGEWATNTDIPGITIGTSVLGGTPRLWFSGQATTDGVYYVEIMQYNYPDPATEITLQFIVTGAENPSPTSRTFQTDSLGSGLYIDGTLYPWGQIYLYYVSEDAPSVSIEGVSYPGGLYMFNTFLDKGHLYLVSGKNNHIVDLGVTTNAWSIQLNGLWAVSTAYYTGENVATSVVVWDKPGTWQWDMSLFIIVFMAVNIIGLVICVRFTELSLWDWVIPICACVVAFIMLG